MAYENVTPPALPSYDTAAYPKYVLVFDYGAKESDWYQVHLYYSATAFTYNGSVATNSGVVFKQVYDDSIGAWTDYGELSGAVNLSPGLKDGVYQRIYTNHDILDGEGTVWLAADSVTPVEETGVTEEWLHSFKTGLALGLCGKALPWKAEPVAWLYNGVRLPKLPEWDKETYPYAYVGITTYQGIEEYRAYFAKEKHTKSSSAMGFITEDVIRYRLIDGQWVEHGPGISAIIASPLWSNVDIYYNSSVEEVGGTLYLAASEPVPVYE